MYKILTLACLFIAMLFLFAAIYNAYKIKNGINSIKNKKTYLFILINITTAMLLIIFYLIFAIDKFNEIISYQDLYVSFLFVLSSAFIFIASIVTKKMGQLLYTIDKLRITDPLTKIYNRAHIDNAIKEEYIRCKRYHRQSCLLMIDINDFKQINDSYGHLVGDKVLIHLINSIKAVKRQSDIIGRFGGDEFLILMPEATIEQSKALAQRIHEIILNNPLRCNDRIITYTVAIGCSDINNNDVDYTSWLHHADVNLYDFKKQMAAS